MAATAIGKSNDGYMSLGLSDDGKWIMAALSPTSLLLSVPMEISTRKMAVGLSDTISRVA
jgi:hypothetical protein